MTKLLKMGAPLLACGQTVFWDEPVKAALRQILDTLAPEVEMIAAVHDTDYFSRAPAGLGRRKPFSIISHNDRSTKHLWAATGEISALFGCELVPAEDNFAKAGISLERAAKASPQGRQKFLNQITEAWGWKGLVHSGDHLVACDVRLKEVTSALLELLEWGFKASAASLATPEARSQAQTFSREILGWVENYTQAHPQATLPQLYEEMLARFYQLLLGRQPTNLTFTSSSKLFLFNSETAMLPRFRLLEMFLRPESRKICCRAYDEAVAGSGTYEVERFGEGALPFDVVIPGQGRGTLHVCESYIIVQLENQTLQIQLDEPVEDATRLAELLKELCGPEIALIGKAIVFPLMLSAEFVLVLHEGGSVYIPYSKEMHQLMTQRGLELPLYPILRLRYRTWDSLATTSVNFNLPPHLAQAFGQKPISGPDFAANWKKATEEQSLLLKELQQLKSPADLLSYLAAREESWKQKQRQWEQAREELERIGERVRKAEAEAREVEKDILALKEQIMELQADKGFIRRSKLRPLREKLTKLQQQDRAEAEKLQPQIVGHNRRREEIEELIKEKRAEIRRKEIELVRCQQNPEAINQNPRTIRLRQIRDNIEAQAELRKAELARDAFLTQGLWQTNYRPTAWWFPFVDPQNKWFREVVRSPEIYFEDYALSKEKRKENEPADFLCKNACAG